MNPDIIGRSDEYLIRKFAEGSGQSAGVLYPGGSRYRYGTYHGLGDPAWTPPTPCCGSAGLLIKCELVLQEKMCLRSKKSTPLPGSHGQENEPGTWAMANMNMIIHDMEGESTDRRHLSKP